MNTVLGDISSKDIFETSHSTQVDSKQENISKIEQIISKCMQFNKLIFNGKVYQNGDNVYIKTEKNQSIGKICRILCYKQQNNTSVPLLEVQWYCFPSDLPEKYKKYLEVFSLSEVFLSEVVTVLFIDQINGKCEVLNFEQFDKLESHEKDTYFIRANYNVSAQNLVPPVEQWKKLCLCEKPQNPDLLYIQCDRCKQWFHISCLGISKEQSEQIAMYHCPKCLQENKFG